MPDEPRPPIRAYMRHPDLDDALFVDDHGPAFFPPGAPTCPPATPARVAAVPGRRLSPGSVRPLSVAPRTPTNAPPSCSPTVPTGNG